MNAKLEESVLALRAFLAGIDIQKNENVAFVADTEIITGNGKRCENPTLYLQDILDVLQVLDEQSDDNVHKKLLHRVVEKWIGYPYISKS